MITISVVIPMYNAENNELDELKKQLLNKVIKEKYRNGKEKSC